MSRKLNSLGLSKVLLAIWTVVVVIVGEVSYADCRGGGGPCYDGVVEAGAVGAGVGGSIAGVWAAIAGKSALQIAGYTLLGGVIGPILYLGSIVAYEELTSRAPVLDSVNATAHLGGRDMVTPFGIERASH
jgi:hypothetical protein